MNQSRWTDDQVEQTMGRLLRAGVILSASVVLLGGAIYVARHGREVPDYATFHSVTAPLRSITGTVESATSFDGQGIIQLGVLLLIATPVARVGLSVVAFAQQRDRQYVLVTLFVLAVLFYSLARGYLEQPPDAAVRQARLPAVAAGRPTAVRPAAVRPTGLRRPGDRLKSAGESVGSKRGLYGLPTPRLACGRRRRSSAGCVARVPSPFRS